MNNQSKTFSGGMKRKLSLAIALVGESPALFLDEPSTGVDVAGKRFLWDVIKRRPDDQTCLLTTHSMEEAEHLADRMAIQVQGRCLCLGTPLERATARDGTGLTLRSASG